MPRNFLAILFLVVANSFISAQVTLEQYVEFGVPVVIAERDAVLSQHPHKTGMYQSIDVDAMKTEKVKSSNLRFQSDFSIALGHIITSPKGNFMNIEMGYAQYGVKGLGSGLRFSDMIDPDRGFVKSSIYSVEKFYYAYRMFNLDISGGTNIEWKNHRHSFSCGLRSTLLLQTAYMVEVKHSQTGQLKYTKQKDLRISNGGFNLSPFFQYDFSPSYSTGRMKYSMSFTNMNLLYKNDYNRNNMYNQEKYISLNRFLVCQVSISRVLRKDVVKDLDI